MIKDLFDMLGAALSNKKRSLMRVFNEFLSLDHDIIDLGKSSCGKEKDSLTMCVLFWPVQTTTKMVVLQVQPPNLHASKASVG